MKFTMVKYLYRVLTFHCTECGSRKKLQAGGVFCPKCQMRILTMKVD